MAIELDFLKPEFITDEEGRRVAVQISVEQYERLVGFLRQYPEDVRMVALKEELEDLLDALELQLARAQAVDFVDYEVLREQLVAEGLL